MENVRVRFAPSPTGALHLGGARTAIYNWLFARSRGGKFLLRIEDTDPERSKVEYVSQIYESLHWLGLDWDEEPVFQSKRLAAYQQAVRQLISSGKAYYCFCSSEELETRRKENSSFRYDGKCRSLSRREIEIRLEANQTAAVRFKVEPGVSEWKDLVYGLIKVDNIEIDDFVLARSNGIPTYQLAVVVDDIYMNISHVIRGEDHISNTPKQILLYQALNHAIPEFAHLPLLLGNDGKRLSKRHGATGVDEYRQQGYPNIAVLNYLALLGWVPEDGVEILLPDELIKHFQIEEIAKKAAVFDIKKFDWVSNEHIKHSSAELLYPQVLSVLMLHELIPREQTPQEQNYILSVIDLMKSRLRTLQQFAELGSYFFKDPQQYDIPTAQKNWKSTEVNQRMKYLEQALQQTEQWDTAHLEDVLRNAAEKLQISAAKLIHPTRLAISGFGVGPGIFELMVVLGKERVLRRIAKALTVLTHSC
jgi:glutamyl-tRNA synthetase